MTNLNVFLDLDETLVHSSEDRNKLLKLCPYSDPNMLSVRSRLFCFSLESYSSSPTIWGIIRPHTCEFIDFCFRYFKNVFVWSAGLAEYVDRIVTILFDYPYIPTGVYSRDHCHYNDNGDIFKPIEDLIDEEGFSHQDIGLHNTLFIDDRKLTFSKNPDNGILIPRYHPEGSVDAYLADDNALIRLMRWLQKPEVMKSRDVRLLDKKHIF